jgi:hypothetical protein
MGYDATYFDRSTPTYQRNLPSAASRVLFHYARHQDISEDSDIFIVTTAMTDDNRRGPNLLHTQAATFA